MHLSLKGASQFQHLQEVQKQTGKAPVELEAFYELSIPDEVADTWDEFLHMSRRRGYNEHGALPLSYESLHAYQTVHGTKFSDLEVAFIFMFDDTFMTVYSKKQSALRSNS